MFLTVKQRTGQKTTEIIINFRASSAFSAHFALGTPKFWGIECGFTVKVHSISTSGVIGLSQNTPPVRAMSQLAAADDRQYGQQKYMDSFHDISVSE